MSELIQFPRGAAQYTSDEIIPAVKNYYKLYTVYKETEEQVEKKISSEWKKIKLWKRFIYWVKELPFSAIGCHSEGYWQLYWDLFYDEVDKAVSVNILYSHIKGYIDTYHNLKNFSECNRVCYLTPDQVGFVNTFSNVEWREKQL